MLNAQSARKKAVTIIEHIIDLNADFMFVTETWLKPQHTAVIKQLTPPGYAYCGESSQGTGTGGGVGLIYKSTL